MALVQSTAQYALSSTPQEVAPAAAGRELLMMRYLGDGIALLGDSTATEDTGFLWTQADGPFVESTPTLTSWWAVGPNGGTLFVLTIVNQ